MTSLFTVSNIYFSIYYIPTSQLLITILLVWEEGGLVGGGTQQYDRVLECVYMMRCPAIRPLLGLEGLTGRVFFLPTPEDERRLELEEPTGMFRPRPRKSPLLNMAP